MEQLTLNKELQFRLNTLDIPTHFIEGEPDAYKSGFDSGFQAGAEWQKEQYKEAVTIMRQLLTAYDLRYPNVKQLLVGYTNGEAFSIINKIIEPPQD